MAELAGNPVAHLTEYELRYLAVHFDASGRAEDLHRLLALEADDQRNVWYEAKAALGDTAGYLADVARAWRLAAGALHDHQFSISIAFQCRYALITASVNSRAENTPAVLLAMLVAEGLWPPAQALAHAHQAPDREHRVRMLTALIPHLPAPLQEEALHAALKAIWQNRWGLGLGIEETDALASLAPYLPQSLIPEALSIAKGFPQVFSTKALVALITRLATLGYPEQALSNARAIEDHHSRARSLIALALRLPNSECTAALQEALVSAKMIKLGLYRVQTISDILHHLPCSERHDISRGALPTIWTIEDAESQVRAVGALAPHLPEPQRTEALSAALDVARELENTEGHVRAHIILVPHLAENERGSVVQDVLEAVRDLENHQHWPDMLANLIPHLSGSLLRRTQDFTRAIKSPAHRVRSLAVLIPYLTETQRGQVLNETLDSLQETGHMETRVEVLVAIAPYLPTPLMHKALSTARTIRRGRKRAEALTVLASYLPEAEHSQVIGEALTATQVIADTWPQVRALFALAHHLPESTFEEVLTIAQMIEADHWKAMALAAIATYLPEPKRIQVLKQALAAARAVRDSSRLTEALTSLAPHLPEGLLLEALAIAQHRIRDPSVLVRAQAPLAFHLSEPECSKVFRQALHTAWLLGGRNWVLQVQSLVFLVPYLPDSLVSEALTIAHSLPEQRLSAEGKRSPRVEVLIALSPRLPEPERIQTLQQALTVTRTLGQYTLLVQVLICLIPHLPESERARSTEEALAAMREVKPEWLQATMLADLAPHFPKSKRVQILTEALNAAQRTKHGHEQAQALIAIASHLSPNLLSEAATIARAITDRESRGQALVALSPYLPEPIRSETLKEALAAIRRVESQLRRSRVLVDLAAQLATLPKTTLASLWCETLPELARRSRVELLVDLEALDPVIVELGGSEAVAGAFSAIQDVGRWWP